MLYVFLPEKKNQTDSIIFTLGYIINFFFIISLFLILENSIALDKKYIEN